MVDNHNIYFNVGTSETFFRTLGYVEMNCFICRKSFRQVTGWNDNIFLKYVFQPYLICICSKIWKTNFVFWCRDRICHAKKSKPTPAMPHWDYCVGATFLTFCESLNKIQILVCRGWISTEDATRFKWSYNVVCYTCHQIDAGETDDSERRDGLRIDVKIIVCCCGRHTLCGAGFSRGCDLVTCRVELALLYIILMTINYLANGPRGQLI